MGCNGDCANCKTFSAVEMPASEYSFDAKGHPVQAIYSLTNDCNLRCPYCFNQRDTQKTTLETARKVADYVIKNGEITGKKPGITFFGGEPLLMLEEIIKPIILEYGDKLTYNMTTNGTLLTEEIIDFLKDHNVQLLLSMDGCKEVQDRQRPLPGGSSFDVLKNIIPYLLIRYPDITVRATVTKFSLNYLQESKEFFEKIGFKFFTMIPNHYEEWTEEDYNKWQYFLDTLGIEILGHFIEDTPFTIIPNMVTTAVNEILDYGENGVLKPPASRCGMGHYGVGVSFDGKLHPCQEDNSLPGWVIGDVENGVDEGLQKQYYDLLYQKYCEFIDRVGRMNETNSFKIYVANSYCPTRLREGCADNPTAILHLKGLHKCATRIGEVYGYSLHPVANRLFGRG